MATHKAHVHKGRPESDRQRRQLARTQTNNQRRDRPRPTPAPLRSTGTKLVRQRAVDNARPSLFLLRPPLSLSLSAPTRRPPIALLQTMPVTPIGRHLSGQPLIVRRLSADCPALFILSTSPTLSPFQYTPPIYRRALDRRALSRRFPIADR